MTDSELVKASITHLERLERLDVLWNPERYVVSRQQRVVGSEGWGVGRSEPQAVVGGERTFSADLLLDATRRDPGDRDLRSIVERLESWMDPVAPSVVPGAVLFSWGPFRFRGIIVRLDQLWVRFRPDGTPLRGWVRILLRE